MRAAATTTRRAARIRWNGCAATPTQCPASGAALKQLADAAEPLYKTFDDGQKRRFTMLLRMGGQGQDGPPPWRRRG